MMEVGSIVLTPYGQGQVLALRKGVQGQGQAGSGDEEEKGEGTTIHDHGVLPSQITPVVAAQEDIWVTVKFEWSIAYLNSTTVTALPFSS